MPNKSFSNKGKKSFSEKAKNVFNSIFFKTAAMFVAFCIIPINIFNYFNGYYYRSVIINSEITDNMLRSNVISDRISKVGSYSEAESLGIVSTMSDYAKLNDVRLRIIDDNFTVIMDSYSLDKGKTISKSIIYQVFDTGEVANIYNKNIRSVESASPIFDSDKNIIGVALISSDISGIDEMFIYEKERFQIISVSLSFILILIILLFLYIERRKYMQLNKSISSIADGNTEIRLPEKAGSFEYKATAASFNRILDNSAEVDKALNAFVSNASHELKTPMTSMKLIADSLLQEEDVPAEIYRDFLKDIASEIDREKEIIDDLLMLTRMDNSVSTLNISLVNINTLVERMLKKLTPLADEKNIEIVYESMRDIEAEVDDIKLTQVVTNLVENAIKYNVPGGKVIVTLNADIDSFFLRIQDTGIGIPEEHQKNIFQRFYRVDKARSRETGGTGLGLSIVDSIISSHGGQIKVVSKPVADGEKFGETVFTIKIPLKHKK